MSLFEQEAKLNSSFFSQASTVFRMSCSLYVNVFSLVILWDASVINCCGCLCELYDDILRVN